MLAWLIQNGVQLDIKDNDDNTPYQLALKRGDHTRAAQVAGPGKALLNAIEAMHEYGNTLKGLGAPKGQIVLDHALHLKTMVEAQIAQGITYNFAAFKIDFLKRLHSKNDVLSEYRLNWSTLITHVLIALTGIGAITLAGQLLYSTAPQSRPLLFFQKPKTTSKENGDTLEHSLEDIDPGFGA